MGKELARGSNGWKADIRKPLHPLLVIGELFTQVNLIHRSSVLEGQ